MQLAYPSSTAVQWHPKKFWIEQMDYQTCRKGIFYTTLQLYLLLGLGALWFHSSPVSHALMLMGSLMRMGVLPTLWWNSKIRGLSYILVRPVQLLCSATVGYALLNNPGFMVKKTQSSVLLPGRDAKEETICLCEDLRSRKRNVLRLQGSVWCT